MRFVELSEEQWKFIVPHIPPQPIVGRKRANDRKIINSIIFVLIMGCLWHDMPRHYGAFKLLGQARSLVEKGVWNKILAAAQEQAHAIGKLNLETAAVDSTHIDSKKAASRQGTSDLSDAME